MTITRRPLGHRTESGAAAVGDGPGTTTDTPAPAQRRAGTASTTASGVALLVALVVALACVSVWHVTQGTSGLGADGLLRALLGEQVSVGGVSVNDIVTGSRLPRLSAGIAVGVALGVAGALLQSISRNQLASPDTLAVTAGAYFALTAVAAFGVSVPLWASSGVAFVGGLVAAAVVLGLTGRAAGTASTRLILAGSAIAMALDAGTAMLLILFKENTTGLFAWGSGSLAQLNIDASARAAPVIVAMLLLALLLSRRLDVLSLGEDAAASLGVPVRSTRTAAVLCAVLLTSISVTLAGPIAFVGLGAPVLARLLARRVPALRRHLFLLPTAGLLGALLILLAGVGVQSTVRNPLAEPGLLGITAGAGLGAVIVVTTGLGGGGRAVLVALAVIAGLATFAIVALLAWRGGLQPDRFVLIGIGCGYALTAVTTFLLLRSDPWETPRILTWLSGTTYGRSLPDVVPVFVALLIATPLLFVLRRHLDLLAVDDDTPRILGIQLERTCLGVLAIAAVLAAVSVVAVGTVSFVGLVAPHLARGLVGARHSRVIPVAMLLGGLFVLVADALGRTLIAPSQLPAGLMIALVGAPYFVWILRRPRA